MKPRADVLVFGGTSEGRQIIEWLDARGTCSIVACSATEYGASLVAQGRHVVTVQGPLSDDQKRSLMQRHAFCCIVDATHPYAQHISASIDEIGCTWSTDVVRIVRAQASERPGEHVRDAAEAAQRVARTAGNVLLTTGTKDLAAFVETMPDFAERLYVRILPVRASLARAEELGIPAAHVIALQGPFSTQLNVALMREYDIACLVTKESGHAGGFEQKVEAAQELGARLIVIQRPPQQGGVSLQEAQSILEERYGL